MCSWSTSISLPWLRSANSIVMRNSCQFFIPGIPSQSHYILSAWILQCLHPDLLYGHVPLFASRLFLWPIFYFLRCISATRLSQGFQWSFLLCCNLFQDGFKLLTASVRSLKQAILDSLLWFVTYICMLKVSHPGRIQAMILSFAFWNMHIQPIVYELSM